MPASPELIARVAELRQKAKDGTITLEEMKEAVVFLRADREAMPPSKSSPKKPPANADDLLKELGI